MRTAATKSTKSHSASVPRAGGFFKAARSPGFFSPVMRKASGQPLVQTKLSVSKPADPLEKEADRTADKVMRMAEPVPRAAAAPPAPVPPQAQRAASAEQPVQRFGEGTPSVAADAKSEIQRATTGGQALSSDVARVHGAAARRRPGRRPRPCRRERRQPQQPPQRQGVHLPQPRLLRARPVPAGHRRGPTPAGPRAHPHDPAGRHRPARRAAPARGAARSGADPGDHVRLAARRPAAGRAGRPRLLRRQGVLHPRLPDADADPRVQPDQHAQHPPDRGQLPAGADRADPGRRR